MFNPSAAVDATVQEMQSTQEVTNMLSATLERYGNKIRQEAKQEGQQEGKIEGKLEDAANFKKLGVPVETICAATGLSREAVDAL
jgi:predicted transposase/invertase (TIGR01784 family)